MSHSKFKTVIFQAGLIVLAAISLITAGCSELASGAAPPGDGGGEQADHADRLALPSLEAVELDGGRLRVVATTSLIGDVLSQVGGEQIELTTMIKPGQDPHSYTPGAQDLSAAAQAHVIFVNGWGLEAALAEDLQNLSVNVPVVPISAGIEPLDFVESLNARAEHEDHEEREDGEEAEAGGERDGHAPDGLSVDPHVWFSIANAERWTENAAEVFSKLDPENAAAYASKRDRYLQDLAGLRAYVEAEINQVPEDRRLLVTNHDSLSYFMEDYGFELVGTVLPAASTLAEPSASDLAVLIEMMEQSGLCTIFTETTVADTLARTVAAELDQCDEVRVIVLYTGGLGPPGSGAASFIEMYRYNVDAIVGGLK
ncbi:MAG: metal ABC transporter substrate-binding protein [Anaerolineales bacterium]|nr:metal ABC transporter substrate-binding protein [Anaerolineales bacterium]